MAYRFNRRELAALEIPTKKDQATMKLLPTLKQKAVRLKQAKLRKKFVEPSAETTLTLPIEVRSEQNYKGGWQKLYRLKQTQKNSVAGYLNLYGVHRLVEPPVHVHLVRLGGVTAMDEHENLPLVFKGVVDGIARYLEVDDGDKSKVTWSYGQDALDGPEGIRVTFSRRTEEPKL